MSLRYKQSLVLKRHKLPLMSDTRTIHRKDKRDQIEHDNMILMKGPDVYDDAACRKSREDAAYKAAVLTTRVNSRVGGKAM